MENHGEFKHGHVYLYVICVTVHYSPGVLEAIDLNLLNIHVKRTEFKPHFQHCIIGSLVMSGFQAFCRMEAFFPRIHQN